MACYKPLEAARLEDGSIVFNARVGQGDQLLLACGQCIGCRIDRSKTWAIRCMHESTLYEDNCFLTLTYDDDHLPDNGDLNYGHFQGFMKRLRKRFSDRKIRFYMCGEYGELNKRPHYHAILFNIDFPDKQKFFKTGANNIVYRSEILERLWPYGQSSIGSVTEQSAGYVARYVMKKILGRGNDINPDTGRAFNAIYERINGETGEIKKVTPEFTRMSLKPGIGQDWFNKYFKDVYNDDAVVLEGGRKVKPPRYYDKKYELIDPDHMESIKQERVLKALKNWKDNTPERLAVKEIVQTRKVDKLIRTGV